MNLSVREIYALADLAMPEGHDSEGEQNFRMVMERATEVLAAQTELPTFEEWAARYQASPEQYDSDLIGFWRDQV